MLQGRFEQQQIRAGAGTDAHQGAVMLHSRLGAPVEPPSSYRTTQGRDGGGQRAPGCFPFAVPYFGIAISLHFSEEKWHFLP